MPHMSYDKIYRAVRDIQEGSQFLTDLAKRLSETKSDPAFSATFDTVDRVILYTYVSDRGTLKDFLKRVAKVEGIREAGGRINLEVFQKTLEGELDRSHIVERRDSFISALKENGAVKLANRLEEVKTDHKGTVTREAFKLLGNPRHAPDVLGLCNYLETRDISRGGTVSLKKFNEEASQWVKAGRPDPRQDMIRVVSAFSSVEGSIIQKLASKLTSQKSDRSDKTKKAFKLLNQAKKSGTLPMLLQYLQMQYLQSGKGSIMKSLGGTEVASLREFSCVADSDYMATFQVGGHMAMTNENICGTIDWQRKITPSRDRGVFLSKLSSALRSEKDNQAFEGVFKDINKGFDSVIKNPNLEFRYFLEYTVGISNEIISGGQIDLAKFQEKFKEGIDVIDLLQKSGFSDNGH